MSLFLFLIETTLYFFEEMIKIVWKKFAYKIKMKMPRQRKRMTTIWRKEPDGNPQCQTLNILPNRINMRKKKSKQFFFVKVNVDICKAHSLFHFSQTRNHCPYIRCMCSKINNHNILFTEKGWIYGRNLFSQFVCSLRPFDRSLATEQEQGKQSNRFKCIIHTYKFPLFFTHRLLIRPFSLSLLSHTALDCCFILFLVALSLSLHPSIHTITYL